MAGFIDLLDVAHTLADFGFAGATAFLLWERFITQKRRDAADEQRTLRVAEAIQAHALSNQRLGDAVEHLDSAMVTLTQEVRLLADHGHRR